MNRDDIRALLRQESVPYVVLLFAPSRAPALCGLESIFLERHFANKVKVVRVPVDVSPDLVLLYRVQFVPCFVVIDTQTPTPWDGVVSRIFARDRSPRTMLHMAVRALEEL